MCNGIEKIKCTLMKCHTNVNSTPFTQLPHKFSYIVAILGHNHFESPNTYRRRPKLATTNKKHNLPQLFCEFRILIVFFFIRIYIQGRYKVWQQLNISRMVSRKPLRFGKELRAFKFYSFHFFQFYTFIYFRDTRLT
jgi:hypothetical protein